MSRLAAALLVLAPSAACGGGSPRPPIPDEELSLRIHAEAGEVELGRAFPLTVVRVWAKDLEPEPWRDELLAPLVVRPVEATRREDGRRVEETRRFQAYAFHRERVVVPAPSFRARPEGGGPERVATGAALDIPVAPALPAGTAGEPELPGEPLPEPTVEPFPWVRWSARAGLLLVALVLGGAIRSRMRRARALQEGPAPLAPPVPPVLPHVRALERLQRLRALEPQGSGEIEAYHVEASALLRDYLEERFAIRSRERTTQELLAAPETTRAAQALPRSLLSQALSHCDLVKFARHPSGAPDRARLVEAAERFVVETRPEEARRDSGATDGGAA